MSDHVILSIVLFCVLAGLVFALVYAFVYAMSIPAVADCIGAGFLMVFSTVVLPRAWYAPVWIAGFLGVCAWYGTKTRRDDRQRRLMHQRRAQAILAAAARTPEQIRAEDDALAARDQAKKAKKAKKDARDRVRATRYVRRRQKIDRLMGRTPR